MRFYYISNEMNVHALKIMQCVREKHGHCFVIGGWSFMLAYESYFHINVAFSYVQKYEFYFLMKESFLIDDFEV